MTSAWWFIPERVAPGDPFRYQRSHWTVLPESPAIIGKRVFLTRAGVAQSLDEVLLEGLAVVKSP